MNDDILIFTNEPLPPSKTTITQAILSKENVLQGSETRGLDTDLPQRTILEGRVTFDPRGRIFFIPPQESTVDEPLLAPDREKWDLYLVNCPFTLHMAPGNAYYEELTFFVELTTPGAVAYAMFPDSITAEVEETKTYTFSPQITFKDVGISVGQVGKQFQFKGLRPTITSFGTGESKFYWVHRGFKEQKVVIPETKQALIVLQVPRGVSLIEGKIYYRTVIVKKMVGGFRKKDGYVDDCPIRWELQGAPPLFQVKSVQSKVLEHSRELAHFDVCIFCALAEEAVLCIKEIERLCDVSFQPGFSTHTAAYRYTTIQNKRGEPLTVRVSWQMKSGPMEAGLYIKPVLKECTPYFAAMTGICAGDKRKVKLGDLVVAESAFTYDAGKMVIGKDGQHQLLHDLDVWHPSPETLHFVRMFQQWRAAIAAIARPHSQGQSVKSSSLPEIFIAPIASGNTVRGDNPFDEIRMLVRNTLAIDMEAATFYRAVAEFPEVRSLLVKGVSDYADGDKDDTYHDYASAGSAAYILSFIKEYLTSDRIAEPGVRTRR